MRPPRRQRRKHCHLQNSDRIFCVKARVEPSRKPGGSLVRMRRRRVCLLTLKSNMEAGLQLMRDRTFPEPRDLFRISLFYCYVPIRNVDDHISFHLELCRELDLNGRIRVASEGVNGVLSGLQSNLLVYEQRLQTKLGQEFADGSRGEQPTELGYVSKDVVDLDMKFCRLRQDLPVTTQLFHSLSIKATHQLVSLVELDLRKEAKDSTGTASSDERPHRRRLHRKQPQDEPFNFDRFRVRALLEKGLEEKQAGTPASEGERVPHLSPAEWNEKITELAQDPRNDVILLDCRNVYESNIGYFRAPNTSTLLTNTRKCSELPLVLLDQADRLSQSSHIFSFCTGGVRCERATLFLDQMLEEHRKSKREGEGDVVKPKLYQLHGGIQRYLESDKTDLFKGKNFVFDPRRTDPNHTDSIVGRCVQCGKQHDDYDNGHAPAEHTEARCCKCRILLLVCEDCRPTVACAGEHQSGKPLLYCGGLEETCLQLPPVRVFRN